MGLVSLVQRAWSVPPALSQETWRNSRQPEAPPLEYGDYIATSNEVFSAVSLRARLMSGLPLRLYSGEGPQRTEVVGSTAGRLLAHVNPFWTWERLSRMDEMSMGLWGETFWAVERGARGVPQEIWWLKPSQVTPIVEAKDYITGYLYVSADGHTIEFKPNEIVWFRYPSPLNEFTALSPMGAARLAADTASAMQKSNQRLFKHGMQLAGIVAPKNDRVTFSPDQAADLERQLESRFMGADKAHRWAVLRYDAQFSPMGVSPKDAEFVNGLNMTLRQVCNAYGIPSPLLNDMEHATLSNAREYERLLWAHSLVPDAKLRAGEIREQFLPMFRNDADHCEFDLRTVPALQEAESEIWSREYQAMEVGAMTINEWRAKHGLPPVPWGDVFWAPVNKQPVDDGSAAPTEPAVPTEMPRTVTEFLSRAGLNGSH